jgi:hypothetical protein
MARDFRKGDNETPIVLMGYYNPIYIYGVEPEMDEELCLPALKAGLNFIRLATPTTDDKRLPRVLSNTSGFVYYVSMTGITGSAIADTTKVNAAVDRIKSHTDLPVCVGFGVKTAEQARAIGKSADGVVVGTAIVNQIANTLDGQRPGDQRYGRKCRHHGARACNRGSRGAACTSRVTPPHNNIGGTRRRRAKPIKAKTNRRLRRELDHQLRQAQDQFDARPPRGAGESLDQMPRNRRNGVPQ